MPFGFRALQLQRLHSRMFLDAAGLRPTRNLTILAASRAAVRADVTPPRVHQEQEKIP